jgi:hypothetical protein
VVRQLGVAQIKACFGGEFRQFGAGQIESGAAPPGLSRLFNRRFDGVDGSDDAGSVSADWYRTPAADDEAFFVSFEPQRALGVSLP